jgi:predicted lysophospholipase L1 biosynthesis ABC-type transport system permease subunit
MDWKYLLGGLSMAEKRFRGWASLELLSNDLRQACRQFYKAPVFTATAALVLAAGLGVSIAIFSIVRNVLLAPLRYKEPGKLVQIVSQWPKTGDQNGWSAPERDAFDWKTTRRFLLVVLVFFAGTALVLSTLGVYGLISFIATSRMREVGIRIALGATRGSIGKLIISQGVRLALLGEGVGLLASAALARLLSSLLYGVRSFDAEILLLTMAVLGMTTTAAAFIPAYRVTRLQPMSALRAE